MTADRRPARAHPLDGLLTVMWHYIRAPGERPRVGASAIDPAAFDAQLDAIGRHRTVVGWPAVAAALAGGPALPDDAALLTFDDGLADHARTVAPRLLERGFTGIFFVLAREPGERLTVAHAIHVLLAVLGAAGLEDAVRTGLSPDDATRFEAARAREAAAGVERVDLLKRPLQRHLLDVVEPLLQRLVAEHVGPSGEVADSLHLSSTDMARMRAEGLTIGGHGRRHLWFDHEPRERVAAEVAASASLLAEEPRPWAFAYPYGASSRDAIDVLASGGFGAAFRASPRSPAGLFDLGRIDAEDGSFPANIVRAAEAAP